MHNTNMCHETTSEMETIKLIDGPAHKKPFNTRLHTYSQTASTGITLAKTLTSMLSRLDHTNKFDSDHQSNYSNIIALTTAK
jgi:hypothetical protein